MENEKIIIEKIRNSYIDKTEHQTKLDELKALDKQVKLPALIFAYVYGVIGSLILGTGMCLAMKVIFADISAMMPVGIVIGLIGIALVSTTYSIYNKILKTRKQKYSQEIISKSNELLNK